MNTEVVYNECFELIYFMKRKEDCLTDDELIIFMYMFNLRKAKMTDREKDIVKKKTVFSKTNYSTNTMNLYK